MVTNVQTPLHGLIKKRYILMTTRPQPALLCFVFKIDEEGESTWTQVKRHGKRITRMYLSITVFHHHYN